MIYYSSPLHHRPRPSVQSRPTKKRIMSANIKGKGYGGRVKATSKAKLRLWKVAGERAPKGSSWVCSVSRSLVILLSNFNTRSHVD